MSSGLEGVDLKYPPMDIKAFTIFKVVKKFCPFILNSQTNVIVPYLVMRNLLVQKELGEK